MNENNLRRPWSSGYCSFLTSIFALAAIEDAPWPNVCATTPTAGYAAETRCPLDATCCKSQFSASGEGCCPWPNAVCCKNSLTCCPQGTTCSDYKAPGWPSWGAVTTCVPSNSNGDAGPPLPADPTRKNILVIGDSVSLGYTPVVAKNMAAEALVQHAPWGGDGGAEETAYGVQCLDYWLRYSNGSAYAADLVYFNFGLHDGPQLFNAPPANVTIPGQEGNMTVYAPELTEIATRLKAYSDKTGARLLFGITSPMINSPRADQDVVELNRRAAIVMSSASIPTINLHDAVIAKCGPVPQSHCFNASNCFSPHCAEVGYEWLANSTIVPAFKKILGLK
eukprot:gene1691-34605_t